ncbi:MAG TPA: HEAT repeat domain-containing protein [Gemmatimonadaceae bacterium]|jgi:HEAT repeat protein|nr:HEAT repeat domain-containing protein [Gemmatimonadaceae bacterium]
MKQLTVGMLALTVAVTAAAQDPTPPARPARPSQSPAPTPTPAAPRAPRPAIAPTPRIDPFDFNFDFDVERIRDHAQEMAREAARIDREQIREMADQARELAREQTRMQRDFTRDFVRDFAMAPTPPVDVYVPSIDLHMPDMDVHVPEMDMYMGQFGGDFTNRLPAAPWAQGDPADSLYRSARDALGRGDFGRAARLFNEIVQKYPKSAYFSNAQYYEALARYKVGTTDDLRQAARILEPLAKNVSVSTSVSSRSAVTLAYADSYRGQRRNADESEIAALYARVNGALAQRGDADARNKVNAMVSQAGSASCDQEDIQVRTEALNALSQMDPASATPILRRVIDRKDECSASLRRSAVFMLGRRADADATSILIGVAKSDPNSNVRIEAINFLPRMPGDAPLTALEEILRSDQDERIQRAAVRALMSSDNQKARSSMRSLIDRKDAPINLRIEAVSSLSGDRATTEDAAYLRSLYARADNDRLKDAIIGAVSRMGGAENDQWVLGIVRNANESSSLRSAALSRFSRSSTVSVADLAKLYDTADSYDLRSRVVNILGNRKEPEATDKLIDIAKTSTVVSLRKEAINALARKNDPRTTQLLLDIVDGKKP